MIIRPPLTGQLTGIDTNVLLRALLQDDPVQSPVAAKIMLSFTPENPGFVTQVALVETYWMLSRSVKLPHHECLRIMRALILTDSLEFDDGEGVMRALLLAEGGADFADALIQGAMELFGANRTVTFDRKAAGRLGWELLSE